MNQRFNLYMSREIDE